MQSNYSGFHILQGAYVNTNSILPPSMSPPVDTGPVGFHADRFVIGIWWSASPVRLHKYLRGKSLRRSTCLLLPPLVLTIISPFPHTLSFYYANSYTDLLATRQLYDLRFNSIDSPTMIPLFVRADECFLPFNRNCSTRSQFSLIIYLRDGIKFRNVYIRFSSMKENFI